MWVTLTEHKWVTLGERRGPVVLEFEQPLGDGFGVREVVGRKDLALDDGKVDFDLIQPTGMDGAVDQHQPGILLLEPRGGGGTAMRGSIVHDPEHAPGFVARWPRHDLLDQSVTGSDPGAEFTTAEDSGSVDIQGRQVGPRATALVFMLHLHRRAGLRGKSSVSTAARLNAGFLVGRNNKLIVFERLVFPGALVEIQNASRFAGELRISRKDPSTVLPRPDGIRVQPSPHRNVADGSHQSRLAHLPAEIGHTPAGQRNAVRGGQFTS